jgi:hypothetical protein
MRLGYPHPKVPSSLVKNNCFLLSGSIFHSKKCLCKLSCQEASLNNRLVYQTLVLFMLLLLFTRINTLALASVGLQRAGSHPITPIHRPPPTLFQAKEEKNTDLHYFMADR